MRLVMEKRYFLSCTDNIGRYPSARMVQGRKLQSILLNSSINLKYDVGPMEFDLYSPELSTS